MKKNFSIFKLNLINVLTEKETILIWSGANGIALVGILALWFASDSTVIAGFSKNQLVSYYFFMFIYSQIIGWWVFWDVRQAIRDGSISNFLIKPISYVKYLSMRQLAYKFINLVTQLFVGCFLFIFLRNYLSFELSSDLILRLVPVALIGIGINFLSHFAMGCFTFFWTESYFLSDFHWIFSRLLSGLIVPLAFFPLVFQKILVLNPFRYTFSLPAEIIFGTLSPEQYFKSLLVGGLWVLFFAVASMIIWKLGLKKYGAFGS